MLFFLADEATAITSFTPLSGPVGTELRIFGTGLGGQAGAAVGGVALTGFTVVSNTEVRGTVAAGTASGPVTVGAVTGPVDFTVVPGSPGGGYTDEQAQDAAAQLFASGTHTNITFTYDDANNRIDASVPASYTAENARDDIGAALVAGNAFSNAITFTADDTNDRIRGDLDAGGLSEKLLYWNTATSRWEPLGIGAGLVVDSGFLKVAQGVLNVPFAAVSLLLPMNGTNGGTSFPDSSSNNLSVSASGAITSTAQFKWGTASALFAGGTEQISLPSNAVLNMGTGDFTLEMWIRPNALTSERNLFKPTGSSANGLSVNASGKIVWWLDGTGALLTGTTTVALNTWYYVAVKRDGATLSLHVAADGAVNTSREAITTDSTAWDFSSCRIGQGTFNSTWDGYIDDFRLTKGYARDVSVTPTAAFPTS